MDIKIQRKFIRTSPDKIRPLINLIRKWNVEKAIAELSFINKHSAKTVMEIVKSAADAAKNKDIDIQDLNIKTIYCNEGPRLKRRRIIHRGRARAINKRMSHVVVIVSDSKPDNLVKEKANKAKNFSKPKITKNKEIVVKDKTRR